MGFDFREIHGKSLKIILDKGRKKYLEEEKSVSKIDIKPD